METLPKAVQLVNGRSRTQRQTCDPSALLQTSVTRPSEKLRLRTEVTRKESRQNSSVGEETSLGKEKHLYLRLPRTEL